MKDRSCPHCGVDLHKSVALLSCSLLFFCTTVLSSGLLFYFWLVHPLMIEGGFIFGFTFLALAIAGHTSFDQNNSEETKPT